MRAINRLTEAAVKNAKPDKGKFVKRLADGDRLYLQATQSNEGVNRNWIFRYELDGERHDYGLGPYPTVSLGRAREWAVELRLQLLKGIDPLQERKAAQVERLAAKAQQAKAVTFKQCADDYLKLHADDWKNAKHRAQWRSTLQTYAFPVIGDLSVNDVDESHLLKILQPIWTTKKETASRLRARIENVLGYAIAGKFRTGDNPARWSNHLKTLLQRQRKQVEHHAALPYAEAPEFMAELRARDSLSAGALEFAILTAARTNEVIGAMWDEIDLKHKVWEVPAARMKASRPHRVPLCDRAIEILGDLSRHGDYVFASVSGRPLSNMAMLELLKGMSPGHTVHGFRSTFRDWAAERTSYPEKLAELCLAHAVGTEVEKAYRRGDGLQKRVRLMAAWADYLAKPMPKTGEVADLHAERRKRHA